MKDQLAHGFGFLWWRQRAGGEGESRVPRMRSRRHSRQHAKLGGPQKQQQAHCSSLLAGRPRFCLTRAHLLLCIGPLPTCTKKP